jgi:serine protease AprX
MHLLEGAQCPIVGVGQLGELLVSVRPTTLPQLERSIANDTTDKGVANISTIKAIEPFVLPEEPLRGVRTGVKTGELTSLKLRLFRHPDPDAEAATALAFEEKTRRLGVHAEQLNYGESMRVFRLTNLREEHVEEFRQFYGTQSLGAFPKYKIVRPAAQPISKLTVAQFPAPIPGKEYPTVGLIDTGVDPDNPLLNAWVVAREEFVPDADRNYEHGSFVAGLLVHARALNHGDSKFPESSCRIVDVVALPKNGSISEDELLAILWEVVPKYPDVRVWNLSLSGNEPCSDHTFSDLAIALDEIQTKHDVTFVLAAGNYTKPPYRDWPVSLALGDADRVCGPADSVRGLTVGSTAHRDSTSSRVPSSSPSPFSRRGPGPVFLPKPEVTHYGGNCDKKGAHAQIGVLSVDGKGNLAESIGTSFAAPSVAAVLAHVRHQPIQMSNLMAKALVIHSAILSGTSIAEADEFRYRGYGVPEDPVAILGCDPWRATLLFEFDVRAGLDVELVPFAVPECLLSNGSIRGEMTVTLAYEPPLDGAFGAEYCRTNVDVSLGTYDAEEHKRQVNPYPTQPAVGTVERALVEQGFKWSPTKVYRRVMPRGVKGDVWRLFVAATDRSGADKTAVRVALAVTIAGLDRSAPVYNDVVKAMARLGWAAVDVQLRGRPRGRAA